MIALHCVRDHLLSAILLNLLTINNQETHKNRVNTWEGNNFVLHRQAFCQSIAWHDVPLSSFVSLQIATYISSHKHTHTHKRVHTCTFLRISTMKRIKFAN